jgi:hypothetical protein
MTGPIARPPPDLEAHVWAQLRSMPGVTMWAFDATPMALVPWLTAFQVQVDCRAGSKRAAFEVACRAWQVLWQLTDWPDGVVSYVQVTDGPLWLADPEDGTPRYVLRAEVRVHPPRARPTPRRLGGTDVSRGVDEGN